MTTCPVGRTGVSFDRAIGTWDYLWVDAKGHQHFEHAHIYFVGGDVFSYLTINFAKGAYAWQAHLDDLGDEPSDIKFSGTD